MAVSKSQSKKASPDNKLLPKGQILRKDGRVVERKTVYFPPDIIHEMEIEAAVQRRDVSDLLTEASRMYLDSLKKEKKK